MVSMWATDSWHSQGSRCTNQVRTCSLMKRMQRGRVLQSSSENYRDLHPLHLDSVGVRSRQHHQVMR